MSLGQGSGRTPDADRSEFRAAPGSMQCAGARRRLYSRLHASMQNMAKIPRTTNHPTPTPLLLTGASRLQASAMPTVKGPASRAAALWAFITASRTPHPNPAVFFIPTRAEKLPMGGNGPRGSHPGRSRRISARHAIGRLPRSRMRLERMGRKRTRWSKQCGDLARRHRREEESVLDRYDARRYGTTSSAR